MAGGRQRTMKDVVVLGASGLVGRLLYSRFEDRAHGTCFESTSNNKLHRLDLTDAVALREYLTSREPRHVIIAAAFTNVDGCELDPDRSRKVNVDAVASIASVCAEISANCVFFSSDYVFGGDKGPHAVDEPLAPLNVYGRHKVEAERLVSELCSQHLIIRTCNIYGWQPDGMNFVMACWRRGRAGEPMRLPVDQWGSPTHADDLAAGVEGALDLGLQGILHLAGPDYLDRLAWARRVCDVLEVDSSLLEGVETTRVGQAAERPLKGGLDAAESYERLGFRFAGVDEGLRRVRKDLEADEN
jgi:dTDP-4-dehydrorhamnose reductase